jgi:hypothetical protein
MNISYKPMSRFNSWASGLEWMADLKAWSNAYEEQHMVPNINNKMTADETTKLFLYDVPASMYGFGQKLVTTLLDDRLRIAMMYDPPPPLLKQAVEAVLVTRKYLLRYLALPRPWILRSTILTDKPDANGRLHLTYYQAEPW